MLAQTSRSMGTAACRTADVVVAKNASHSAVSRRPIVISGPSGCGKSTLLTKLFAEFPNRFGFSVSHTTRAPRDGEENGVHYHFIEKPKMLEMIHNGMFLEHAEFSGNLYGTSKQAVASVNNQDKICILDLEIQGVKQMRDMTDISPLFVFVKPPSFATLEKRLKDRSTENEASLTKRLHRAEADMKEVERKPDLFDAVVVNDDLDAAYADLKRTLQEFL